MEDSDGHCLLPRGQCPDRHWCNNRQRLSFKVAFGFPSELLLSLPCLPTPLVVCEPLRQLSGATHTLWMALWARSSPGGDAPGVWQRGREPLPGAQAPPEGSWRPGAECGGFQRPWAPSSGTTPGKGGSQLHTAQAQPSTTVLPGARLVTLPTRPPSPHPSPRELGLRHHVRRHVTDVTTDRSALHPLPLQCPSSRRTSCPHCLLPEAPAGFGLSHLCTCYSSQNLMQLKMKAPNQQRKTIF